MAINGKDVQVYMRKVLNVSIKFVWNSMKTHPHVSCTSMFLALLYTCFPWHFWFLIYSCTIILLVVSTAKIYYRIGNANNTRKDEKKSDAEPLRTRKLVKNDFHARSVRRRRARDDLVQAREEEKSTIFSSTVNTDMVDKSALIEEHPKEIREVEMVDSAVSHGECSSLNISPVLKNEFRGKPDEVETESSDSTGEEDDEREREENKKAVQWNEDDQKNLVDLGISEIERNYRLESLIARRRARKMMSLQVRRTLMNMENNTHFGHHITPLMVPRNNSPSLENYTPSGQFSPMPGSAPSVLIPMHNPFDIPYDPQEEKPILTGGSFDQEFLPLHQKEMFCRHESFSLGPFFPGELKQDRSETSWFHDSAKKQSEGHETSKLENKIDEKETDKIIEVESSRPPESNSNVVGDHSYTQEDVEIPEQETDLVDDRQEEETSEVKTKLMLDEDLTGESSPSSSSSSEEEEQFSRIDKEAILKSLSSQVSRKISTNRDNKMGEHFVLADQAFHHHTPTCSIASDLQVEVSEISSPLSMVDGSISSHNEEAPIYEGSIEGEITPNSEDKSAESSDHQYGGVDENELRDIHEVSENDNIEVSSIKSSEDHVALQKSSEKIIEEAPNPLTNLTSNAELPDRSQEKTSVLEEAQQLTGEVMTQTSQKNGVPEKPEKQLYSSENTEREVNRTYTTNDSSILQNSDAKNFRIGDKDNVADAWTQEAERAHAEWSLTSSPTFIGYTGEPPADIIEEHEEILAYYKEDDENDNPRISRDSRGESINIPQHENLDMIMPVEEHDIPELNQDNLDESQAAELRPPEATDRYTGHRVSPVLSHLVVQPVPFASVLHSSPRSVLQPKFSMSTLSLYNDEIHEEIQEFGTPMAENNIVDDPSRESLRSTADHTTTLFVEDPTSQISNVRDTTLQESSDPSTRSTEEAKFTGSRTECTENERGQNELDSFPTMSTEETNSSGSEGECPFHENERVQNELSNFPESSSCPESAESQMKQNDESNSRMPKEKDEGSENLHELEDPDAFANQTAQVEHSSMPLVNAEEPAEHPGRSSEFTGNPRKSEMVVTEMEEKS